MRAPVPATGLRRRTSVRAADEQMRMSIGNRVVSRLLRSPLRRLLERRICLIRYTGRRSGRTITTPVEHVEADDGIVLVAGRAASKSWWRNFRTPRPAELWLDGQWRTVDVAVADDHVFAPTRPSQRRPRADQPDHGDIVLLATRR